MTLNSFDFKSRYKEQLPRRQYATAGAIFTFFAGVASILGFVASPIFLQSEISELFRQAFVYLLLVALIGYIFVKETRKYHRYAQAVFFVHFANHITRDYLAELKASGTRNPDAVLADFLNAVAQCFAIITARKCRCSIKKMISREGALEIETIRRDTLSLARPQTGRHLVEKNTDFKSIVLPDTDRERCDRYFLGTNLPRLWKQHKYENTSFEIYGEPEIRFGRVTNWRLPYRSALVLPIRYMGADSKNSLPNPTDQNDQFVGDYYGFLCIDCNSTRQTFDDRYAPELGGAFADLLYVLFRQSEIIETSLPASVQSR